MRTTPFVLLCSMLLFAGHFAVAASAQEPAADPDAATTQAPTAQPQDPAPAEIPADEPPARGKSDELLSRAKELGRDTIEAVDESAAVKEATSKLVESSERVTEQTSPTLHFAAFAIGLAAVVSFLIQLLGKLYVIVKFKYFDVKEVLSDALSLIAGLIAVAFILKSGDAHGVLVTSGSAMGGGMLLGGIVGIAMGIWGVRQEVESCRTAELLEELSETKAEYGRLRRRAEKMSYSGKKLLEEKRRREQTKPVRT